MCSHKFGKFEQQIWKGQIEPSAGKRTRQMEKQRKKVRQNDVLRTMENNFAKNILLIQHILHGGQSERGWVSEWVYYMHMNHSILCWLARNWLANWLDTNLTHSLAHSGFLSIASLHAGWEVLEPKLWFTAYQLIRFILRGGAFEWIYGAWNKQQEIKAHLHMLRAYIVFCLHSKKF